MARKTKVYERIVIDKETGEILEEVVKFKEKEPREKYVMIRITEGAEWVNNFTGNELALMIILLRYVNNITGYTTLTPIVRKEINSEMKKSDSYVKAIFKSLKDKNGILFISSRDVFVNPLYMYKGSTIEYKTNLAKYNEFKTNKIFKELNDI